jgi:hypothetical protein
MQKMKLLGDHCRCATCGEQFNSTRAFDKHRIGSFTFDASARRCLTVDQMLAKGMARNRNGWWITAARPISTIHSERQSGDLTNPVLG